MSTEALVFLQKFQRLVLLCTLLYVCQSVEGLSHEVISKHFLWRKAQHGRSRPHSRLQLTSPHRQSSVKGESAPSGLNAYSKIFIWAWVVSFIL